jgi:nitrate reductase NapE component
VRVIDDRLIARPSAKRLWPIVAAAVLVTFVFAALSRDFGVTWDEPQRHAHGYVVLKYWTGEPAVDVSRPPRGDLYGALFDVAAILVHDLIGGDVWMARHYTNAVFGGIGVLVTGLLAGRLFGTQAGLTAVVLLALSPRYVADSMNNPKDLPFAAMTALALFSFTLLKADPPFITWRRVLLVGTALALPLNVRPGALLYLGYLVVAVACLHVNARAWSLRQLASSAGRLLLVTLVMLLGGCLLWPWAQQNPFVRPFQALVSVSDFHWSGYVFFWGEFIRARDVPASYLPTWMLITIPPVVLAGTVLSLIATVGSGRERRAFLAFLWLVVLFPIVAAIAAGSTLYDGWRHMLFTYPPLVVLAAAGWWLLYERFPHRARLAVAGLFAIGCVEPVVYMIRNHPHETVYFNAIVGGPRGAAGRFDLDYWGNSLLEATEWSSDLASKSGVPLIVAGQPWGIVRADARRFTTIRARLVEARRHHLELRLLRAEAGPSIADRPSILYAVRTADGAPLAVVLRGPRFGDVRDRLAPFLHQRGN